jgi:hypothetical protein
MDSISISVNEGFDRLQRRLLAMNVGDTLRAEDAADESGLSPDMCRAVLVGLERAGLMTRERADRERFIRITLKVAV